MKTTNITYDITFSRHAMYQLFMPQCTFQLKNQEVETLDPRKAACKFYTQRVKFQRRRGKGPSLFAPQQKSKKSWGKYFPRAGNVFTIYDIRIKLISEIKSWCLEFLPLVFVFSKIEQVEGEIASRRRTW